MTGLPTPEQWVIRRMTEPEVAEMIERHIDYVDPDGRSVHLSTNFVRHYMRRDDGALPTIVAVSQTGRLEKGLCADSEEKHEPVSDIDAAVVDSLKALDPNRPIREATSTLQSWIV